jgi:predicted nucleotidyltransferase
MLIREKDRQAVIALAKQTLNQPLEVLAYGSRVSGEAHDMSDLDLILKTQDNSRVNMNDFVNFKEALQNSNIPIIVQVLDWHRVPESFHKNILQNYIKMVEI